MPTTYKFEQRRHGEIAVIFKNDSATDIEKGEKLSVGGLNFFFKDSIPGYNVAGTENTIPWSGSGFLMHHENARIIEVLLTGGTLGADYTFGQPVVLDGVFVGYAVPHPGPDGGDPGGGGLAVPLQAADATVVAESADTVIRCVAIPPNANDSNFSAILATITDTTTAAQLEADILLKAAAQGGDLVNMAVLADVTAANIDLNDAAKINLAGGVIPAALASWKNGSQITFKVDGAVNSLLYNDGISDAFTISDGGTLTLRNYGGTAVAE